MSSDSQIIELRNALIEQNYFRLHELFVEDESLVTAPQTLEALCSAIRGGDIEMVVMFLRHGANPNLRVFGKTLLEGAVYLGHVEIARILLEHGAWMVPTETFLRACLSRHPEMISLLLEFGADTSMPSPRFKDYCLPLLLKAEEGDMDAVQQLLHYDTSINASSHTGFAGFTSLTFAVLLNKLPLLEILVKHATDADLQTPLKYAASKEDHLDLAQDMIQTLVAHGADLNVTDYDGWTPLTRACDWSQDGMVSVLLEAGADVNAKARGGITPLLAVVDTDSTTLLLTILDAGADINLSNDSDETALFKACESKREDVVRILIRRPDVKINQPDEVGITPLLEAVRRDSLAIARLLIEEGADVHFNFDNQIESPLLQACQDNQPLLVELLLENGADVHPDIFYDSEDEDTTACNGSPLRAACGQHFDNSGSQYRDSDSECSDDELDDDLFVDSEDYFEMVKISLQMGTYHFTVEDDNLSLDTARAACCLNVFKPRSSGDPQFIKGRFDSRVITKLTSQIKIVQLLLHYGGAIPHHRQDHLPLHLVAERGLFPIVFLLLDRGAPVDARDIRGDTALMVAVNYGQVECASVLIARGANMHLCNDEFESPFLRACRLGNLDMIYLMLSLSPHDQRPQLRSLE